MLLPPVVVHERRMKKAHNPKGVTCATLQNSPMAKKKHQEETTASSSPLDACRSINRLVSSLGAPSESVISWSKSLGT